MAFTWPPSPRIRGIVKPDVTCVPKEPLLCPSPLSWTGVDDEPIPIDDLDEDNFNPFEVFDHGDDLVRDMMECMEKGNWVSQNAGSGDLGPEESDVATDVTVPLPVEILPQKDTSTATINDIESKHPIEIRPDLNDEMDMNPNRDTGGKQAIPLAPVTYPNNEGTRDLFRFENYGKKTIQKSIIRKYYKCVQKECGARYTAEYSQDDLKNAKSTSFLETPHNHLPSANPRISAKVKEIAITQMRVGATPANVHAQLMRDASLPLSSADVPTMSQLKNWKYDMSVKDMPTGDALNNIISKHGQFVKECKFHPDVHIVMASDFGLDLLIKSKYVICDGTFETTECKLVLTTLMAFYEDVAIPCAYLLSNAKDTDNYEAYWKIKKATKGRMSPQGVLLDFEEALAQGFVNVFPKANVLGDLFHFVQANVKQIGQLGFKLLAKDVVKGVQSLWYASSRKDFDVALGVFLKEWDQRAPAYASYFCRYWLERVNPEKWASFARADDAPSGSGSIEGFHRRLDANMPRSALALDKMVDFLAAEDEYWKRLVNDPRLWAEKKTQHRASQERNKQKRTTLKHYIERGNNPDRASINITDICEFLSGDESDTNIIDLVDIKEPFSIHELPTTTTTITTTKRRRLHKPIPPEELCHKCRQYKFNGKCSLLMCKTCCCASTDKCTLTQHREAKLGARQPFTVPLSSPSIDQQEGSSLPVATVNNAFKERIQATIEAKAHVFISYNKGTNGTRLRKIKPTAFSDGKHGLLVNAYCYVAKDTRSFYLHLITKVEDSDLTIDTTFSSQVEDQTSPESVKEWLNGIQLGQYWEAFRDNGFDLVEALADLNEAALALMNVKLGHQSLLLRKAKVFA